MNRDPCIWSLQYWKVGFFIYISSLPFFDHSESLQWLNLAKTNHPLETLLNVIHNLLIYKFLVCRDDNRARHPCPTTILTPCYLIPVTETPFEIGCQFSLYTDTRFSRITIDWTAWHDIQSLILTAIVLGNIIPLLSSDVTFAESRTANRHECNDPGEIDFIDNVPYCVKVT